MKKQFAKLVQWSEDDQAFIGYLLGICTGGVCHGKDELKVYKELLKIADEWKEILKKENNTDFEEIMSKTFSGNFNLRLNPDLHKLLAINALKENESLNTYCSKKLAS